MMGQKKKNKKTNNKVMNSTKRKSLERREWYALAFALIISGSVTKIFPMLSDHQANSILSWACFFVASLVAIYYSYLLGNRYGVCLTVSGAGLIAVSVLLGKVYKGNLTSELIVFLLLILGIWLILLGMWNFYRDLTKFSKKKTTHPNRGVTALEEPNEPKPAHIKNIADYLGLLFVILQLVFFVIDKIFK